VGRVEVLEGVVDGGRVSLVRFEEKIHRFDFARSFCRISDPETKINIKWKLLNVITVSDIIRVLLLY
jgi:hypothetical protein